MSLPNPLSPIFMSIVRSALTYIFIPEIFGQDASPNSVYQDQTQDGLIKVCIQKHSLSPVLFKHSLTIHVFDMLTDLIFKYEGGLYCSEAFCPTVLRSSGVCLLNLNEKLT